MSHLVGDSPFDLWQDQSGPPIHLFWKDGYHDIVDFTGATCRLELISERTGSVAFTKNAGIVGSSGTGGTPNIVITWNLNELAVVPAGYYRVRITATKDGKVWVFKRGNLPRARINAIAA